MALGPLPYFGSFQRGRIYKTDNALSEVWRRIERVSTIENLERVADAKKHERSTAKVASIRMRQAIELRRAAGNTTILSRPLVLYYSGLNLARGMMLAYFGSAGKPTHGLRFSAGTTLLECSAEVCAAGTFPEFMKSVGIPLEEYTRKTFALRELLLMVPETLGFHDCVPSTDCCICAVRVEALMGGPTTLRFFPRGMTESEFGDRWRASFPWFSNLCELGSAPFTLTVLEKLPSAEAISKFCDSHLFRDLRHRDDPVWFDYVRDRIPGHLHRMGSYLAALFVLSNVSRYEPELLDSIQRGSELGFFIETFLDAAERFLPQLMLELIEGPIYFT
jgi:hypothetical protein